MTPRDVAAFGDDVAATLRSALSDDLVGVYFVGSIALGGYVPGESDVDVIGVSRSAIPEERRRPIADAIVNVTPMCPGRGLEFTLYRAEVAARPPQGADFELNANGGPRMDTTLHLDADKEPGFWYVLDRAIAHRYGVPVVGPPPGEVFADVSRPALLSAMTQSMRWHREHEKGSLYSVLNACRAWRFGEEDVLGSKLAGAAWARERWERPDVIDAAVGLRRGVAATLDVTCVERLLDHVERVLLDLA